jgi:hypothetical protein
VTIVSLYSVGDAEAACHQSHEINGSPGSSCALNDAMIQLGEVMALTTSFDHYRRGCLTWVHGVM